MVPRLPVESGWVPTAFSLRDLPRNHQSWRDLGLPQKRQWHAGIQGFIGSDRRNRPEDDIRPRDALGLPHRDEGHRHVAGLPFRVRRHLLCDFLHGPDLAAELRPEVDVFRRTRGIGPAHRPFDQGRIAQRLVGGETRHRLPRGGLADGRSRLWGAAKLQSPRHDRRPGTGGKGGRDHPSHPDGVSDVLERDDQPDRNVRKARDPDDGGMRFRRKISPLCRDVRGFRPSFPQHPGGTIGRSVQPFRQTGPRLGRFNSRHSFHSSVHDSFRVVFPETPSVRSNLLPPAEGRPPKQAVRHHQIPDDAPAQHSCQRPGYKGRPQDLPGRKVVPQT